MNAQEYPPSDCLYCPRPQGAIEVSVVDWRGELIPLTPQPGQQPWPQSGFWMFLVDGRPVPMSLHDNKAVYFKNIPAGKHKLGFNGGRAALLAALEALEIPPHIFDEPLRDDGRWPDESGQNAWVSPAQKAAAEAGAHYHFVPYSHVENGLDLELAVYGADAKAGRPTRHVIELGGRACLAPVLNYTDGRAYSGPYGKWDGYSAANAEACNKAYDYATAYNLALLSELAYAYEMTSEDETYAGSINYVLKAWAEHRQPAKVNTIAEQFLLYSLPYARRFKLEDLEFAVYDRTDSQLLMLANDEFVLLAARGVGREARRNDDEALARLARMRKLQADLFIETSEGSANAASELAILKAVPLPDMRQMNALRDSPPRDFADGMEDRGSMAELRDGSASASTHAHNSYAEAAQGMQPSIDLYINSKGNGKKVLVTGHSAGGALAQLVAVHLKAALGLEPHVYTFGAPAVYKRGTHAHWPLSFRHIHGGDALPLLLRYYKDVTPEARLQAAEEELLSIIPLPKGLDNARTAYEAWQDPVKTVLMHPVNKSGLGLPLSITKVFLHLFMADAEFEYPYYAPDFVYAVNAGGCIMGSGARNVAAFNCLLQSGDVYHMSIYPKITGSRLDKEAHLAKSYVKLAKRELAAALKYLQNPGSRADSYGGSNDYNEFVRLLNEYSSACAERWEEAVQKLNSRRVFETGDLTLEAHKLERDYKSILYFSGDDRKLSADLKEKLPFAGAALRQLGENGGTADTTAT